MKRILSFAHLWILALPLVLTLLGAASNQAVIAANHDRFPVLMNVRKLREEREAEEKKEAVIANIVGKVLGVEIQPPAPDPNDDMLDNVHCVMSKDTHLNFLADWIDLGDATYSPGDLLLMAADYIQPLAFPFWFAIVLCDYRRRQI